MFYELPNEQLPFHLPSFFHLVKPLSFDAPHCTGTYLLALGVDLASLNLMMGGFKSVPIAICFSKNKKGETT